MPCTQHCPRGGGVRPLRCPAPSIVLGEGGVRPLRCPALPIISLCPTTASALPPPQARITQLESAMVTKGKELEGLQRMLDAALSQKAPHQSQLQQAGSGGGGAAEGWGGSLGGGGVDGDVRTYKLEAELVAARSRLVHVEHVSRSRWVCTPAAEGGGILRRGACGGATRCCRLPGICTIHTESHITTPYTPAGHPCHTSSHLLTPGHTCSPPGSSPWTRSGPCSLTRCGLGLLCGVAII